MSHPESEEEGGFLLTVTYSDKLLNEDGHWGCPAGEATVSWHHRGRGGTGAGQRWIKQANRCGFTGSGQAHRPILGEGKSDKNRVYSRKAERWCRTVSEALAVTLTSICIKLPLKSNPHFLCILSLGKP